MNLYFGELSQVPFVVMKQIKLLLGFCRTGIFENQDLYPCLSDLFPVDVILEERLQCECVLSM